MTPWREVVSTATSELARLGQEVGGRVVVPNRVVVALPAAGFGRFGPVLAEVTAEMGEALVAWAAGAGHGWYRGIGPFVRLEVRDVERVGVECEFVTVAPP